MILLPELPDGFRSGADPGESGVEYSLGEIGVLGQEAVAGVDGVRSGPCRDVQQFGDVQVGVSRGVPVQAEGFAGGTDVHGIGVDVRIDGDGFQLGVLAGSGNPDGDFTTVGDQDLAHQLLTFLGKSVRGKSVQGRVCSGARRKRMLPPIGTWAARSSWWSTTTPITG